MALINLLMATCSAGSTNMGKLMGWASINGPMETRSQVPLRTVEKMGLVFGKSLRRMIINTQVNTRTI